MSVASLAILTALTVTVNADYVYDESPSWSIDELAALTIVSRSIFMTALELTLSKILEKIHSLRPAARHR